MRLEPTWRQPFGIFLILAWITGWCVIVASVGGLITERAVVGAWSSITYARDRLDLAAQAAAALDGDGPLARRE